MWHSCRNIARKRRHNDKRNAVTEPPRRAGPIAPLADTRRWQSFSRLAVRKESVPAAIPSPPCKPATIDDHQPKETGAGPDISVPDGTELRAVASKNRQGVRKVKVSMYNYGTPRLGNPSFAQLYNRIVPDSFRTVVDGDLMVIFPIFKHYCQIGTQVVVDNLGSGSIIIDPSFIERRLRIKTNSHLSYHSLLVYRKVGLLSPQLHWLIIFHRYVGVIFLTLIASYSNWWHPPIAVWHFHLKLLPSFLR